MITILNKEFFATGKDALQISSRFTYLLLLITFPEQENKLSKRKEPIFY